MAYGLYNSEYCAIAVEGEKADQIWVECVDGDAHIALERFDISWVHDNIDPDDTELLSLADNLSKIYSEVQVQGYSDVTPEIYAECFSCIDTEEYIDVEARDFGRRCRLEITSREAEGQLDEHEPDIAWRERSMGRQVMEIPIGTDPIEYSRRELTDPFARSSVRYRDTIERRAAQRDVARQGPKLSGIDAAIGSAQGSARAASAAPRQQPTLSSRGDR